MTKKPSDAFTALNEIEAFVKVRCTFACAEEAPRRMKAQLQARSVCDAWAGDLSPAALDAMQHACMLEDLLTTFGSSERITDWTATCLAHIARLRSLLVAPSDRSAPFILPSRGDH